MGTWRILTELLQTPARENCAGPGRSGSGRCAPAAFSAEMALDGAIDKILYFCCFQPGLGGPAPGAAPRDAPRTLRFFPCK